MFIKTPEDGYWFTKPNIDIISEKYDAKYLGYWTLKWPRKIQVPGVKKDEYWTSSPVDVFYQPNPDLSRVTRTTLESSRFQDRVC